MEAKKTDSSFRAFWLFSAKAVVVVLLLGLLLDAFLPDFSEVRSDFTQGKASFKAWYEKNFKNERAKLYILSFVQNPAALYKTSEIEESAGRLDNAMRDVELAIGLLEMHGADKQVTRRYNERLEKLKAAAKSKKQ